MIEPKKNINEAWRLNCQRKNIDEAWRLNQQKKNSLEIFHGDFMNVLGIL